MERMSEREREPGGGIEERGGHVNFIPIISFRFFSPVASVFTSKLFNLNFIYLTPLYTFASMQRGRAGICTDFSLSKNK